MPPCPVSIMVATHLRAQGGQEPADPPSGPGGVGTAGKHPGNRPRGEWEQDHRRAAQRAQRNRAANRMVREESLLAKFQI